MKWVRAPAQPSEIKCLFWKIRYDVGCCNATSHQREPITPTQFHKCGLKITYECISTKSRQSKIARNSENNNNSNRLTQITIDGLDKYTFCCGWDLKTIRKKHIPCWIWFGRLRWKVIFGKQISKIISNVNCCCLHYHVMLKRFGFANSDHCTR